MRILALDIGTKRIGTAFADTAVRIAVPRGMIPVDGNELSAIVRQYNLEKAELIVAGLPRNAQGEETQQSQFVRDFAQKLQASFREQKNAELIIRFQDESLTSVAAESRFGNDISRADRAAGKVDAEAAAIILQDFIETTNLDQLKEELDGTK